MQRIRFGRSFIFSMILGLALIGSSGCGQKTTDQDKGPAAGGSAKGSFLEGTIRVSGAWALYPMMVRWGEEFAKVHPKVRVDISAGGAGKGVADALANLVDIGMVSREVNPEEVKKGGFFIPVVKDAVFPVLNQGNPVFQKGLASKGARKKTFIDLWINGRTLTWGEIVGYRFEGQGAGLYKIRLLWRCGDMGPVSGGKKQEDLTGVGVYGDPGLAEAVRKDLFGTGYNNLNYAYDARTGLPLPGLQIIPIDVNENGKVDPEEDLTTKSNAIQAVVSGRYPSPPARDLYLMTKDRFKGPAREFIRWILTDGQKYVDEMGYIKLKETQIDEALKKI